MQSKQTEALKKALTELSWYEEAGLGRISSCDAIHTVREALAEPPAQRKPLTDEEVYKIYRDCGDLNVRINIARAIEAAHQIGVNK